MTTQYRRSIGLALTLAFAYTGITHAAEDFQLRYNLAGTMAGEIFTPFSQSGWIVGTSVVQVDVHGLTGDNGKQLTSQTAPGIVTLPSPAPKAIYPSYQSSTVTIDGTGTLTLTSLAIAYATDADYAGGRLLFGVVLPYGKREQDFTGSVTTPTLNWPNPNAPAAAAKSNVTTSFNTSFQGRVAANLAAKTGTASEMGDDEISVHWLYNNDAFKITAGSSLVLPTGNFSPNEVNVSYGNFYTLRENAQLVYLASENISLAGKMTLGFNTRNKDDQIRSGDWAGLEAAAGYKTGLGSIGVHAVYVNQYQNDSNNPWGNGRLMSANLGGFFTTQIGGKQGVTITLQTMHTLESRDAKEGNFYQIRLIKKI